MLKAKLKSFITVLIVVTLCTCIDPYIPKLNGYESLLVVEGLITNENAPYEVRLSRTRQGADMIPEKVSDAVVSVTDESGKQTLFRNFEEGIYRTDNKVFTGAIGKTYTLNIFTHDGKEYSSEPTTMTPVPEIDTLYYEKEVGFTNNQNETHEGISIYLDSKAGNDSNRYYRWEFEETWKFKVPNPKKWNYINDSTILPVDTVKEYCWRLQKSVDILVSSISPGQITIKKEPICFITPDKSDRLSIQYCILVKQYSISEKEYDFWSNLKKVSENSGEIFDSQPFPVTSNIHNIKNAGEQVLGYFQASAVKQKRKYITFSEVTQLNLPNYHTTCVRKETSPSDYNTFRYSQIVTFDDLNAMWVGKGYEFIEPIYIPETTKLQKLVFAKPVCAVCTMTGTFVKPGFWIDLN